MAEQNWEYCELRLEGLFPEGGKFFGEATGSSFNCSIRYYAPDGKNIYVELSRKGNALTYNPFFRAMAFLGTNGWELVSAQVANMSDSSLFFGQRVAILKRPIIAGRKVNEPELKF